MGKFKDLNVEIQENYDKVFNVKDKRFPKWENISSENKIVNDLSNIDVEILAAPTLDEILEIIDLSDITSMVEVVSKPSVAFSKRKLVSNYYKDMGIDGSKEIIVNEKVSNLNFDIKEDSNGTVFFLDLITNGTGIIRDLYDNGCSYIIMREYGIDNFRELVNDTMEYIKDSCSDLSYVLKYKKLGDSTNFFFKKTIYRVKKNG